MKQKPQQSPSSPIQLNHTEADLWAQVKEDKIDPTVLREMLESLNDEETDIPLTVRSLKFLQLEPDDFQPFASVFKSVPLKRQVCRTQAKGYVCFSAVPL